jgi:hypothetical protein
MPFTFRKSFKIMDGLRLNVNRRSVSLTGSAGPVHGTVSSSGRHTVSANLPGPFGYRKTITRRKADGRRADLRQKIAERRESIRQRRQGR